MRIIHGHEIHASIHEGRRKGHVARETVELGNDEGGPLFLRQGQSGAKLRTLCEGVRPLAGLMLHKFGD